MLIEQGPWMMDILEEHLEELAWLWPLRQSMLDSGDHDLLALGRAERRIAAHADALVLAEEVAVPLLEAAIASDEGNAAAAAHVLLSLRRADASEIVLKALASAAGPVRTGLVAGISAAPSDVLSAELTRLASDGPLAAAVIAAEALAFRGAPPPAPTRVAAFLQDENPDVRRAGWRLVALVRAEVPPRIYSQAMTDAAPGVRDAALRAGAWCGLNGVLTISRQLAVSPSVADLEPLYLLAVLGSAADLPVIVQLGEAAALGPARYNLLGAYGHAAVMPQIIAGLANEDAATAAAAGAAFRKLTGIALRTVARTPVPTGGAAADEFDAEFADEAAVPDPAHGKSAWGKLEPELGKCVRMCYGLDLAQPIAPDLFARLDLRSHAELALRSSFAGARNTSLIDLQRFPRSGGDER